jgi:hypothetical protein
MQFLFFRSFTVATLLTNEDVMGQGESEAPVYGYGHMCKVAVRWRGEAEMWVNAGESDISDRK